MFDGICITLDKTKTIQSAERRQRVPLAQNYECPILCPVRALALLRHMVGDSNITDDIPLFQMRDFAKGWFNHQLTEMGADVARLASFNRSSCPRTI